MNKEEIKKAKEMLNKLKENANIEDADMNDCFNGEHIEAIETLLQYINQLEQENKVLKQCLIDNNTKDINEHLYLGNPNM